MAAPLSTPPAGRPHVVAVFVDAAYLLTAASSLLFDEETRRGIRVREPAVLVRALADRALDGTPGQLLRTYWFDAAPRRVHTVAQREIAVVPHVKVRLGNQNRQGAQKGVDHLLRMEMERLAANRAVTDAVLVTGDEDLLPAVEAAQAYGVTVHLWGVEPRFGANQAEILVWEADTVAQLDREFLEPLFTFVPKVETVRSAPPDALDALVAAARADESGAAQEKAVEVLAEVVPEPVVVEECVEVEVEVEVEHLQPGRPDAKPPTPAEIAALLGVTGVRRPPRGTTAPARLPVPVRPATPTPVRPVAQEDGPPARPLYSTSTGERGNFGLTDLQAVLHEVGAAIARRWLVSRGRENLADLLPHRPTLPTVIDADLLVEAEKQVGYSLRHAPEDRVVLRDGFWSALEEEYEL